MGRPPRLTYAGAMHHVTMRCNNKEFLFDERSQILFVDLLADTREMFDVPLYNYCLMTNHVHLLFEVDGDDVLSRFMHRLETTFSNRFNRIRGRKGHLWEGRFVSTIVEARSYFLRCMAYIDLNPVRAGMVEHPARHEWSAHRFLAAEDESAIALHPHYLGLGRNRGERYAAYSQLLEAERRRDPYSLAGVLFVGSQRFTRKMERQFGIAQKQRPRIQRRDVGNGIRAVERRWGRAPGEP